MTLNDKGNIPTHSLEDEGGAGGVGEHKVDGQSPQPGRERQKTR